VPALAGRRAATPRDGRLCYPSGMRSVVACFVVVVANAGCASADTVRWGEETATANTDASATAAAGEARATTASEYAAKFPTDGSCEAEVRRLDARSRELALKLLGACVERGDFKHLSALVDAPWTSSLAGSPQAATWCARVVAARAGDVDADVKACDRAGFKVKTLEDIFTEPDRARGTLIIFRGRLDPEAKAKRDTRLIETLLEEGEVETTATGRRVGASFGVHNLPARDAILLARAQKLAEDPGAEDGEPIALVEILGSFPAALRPTYD
jgi:hypothetical protein